MQQLGWGELSMYCLETLLAVEAICRAEIIVLYTLRLFRISEMAEKGLKGESKTMRY